MLKSFLISNIKKQFSKVCRHMIGNGTTNDKTKEVHWLLISGAGFHFFEKVQEIPTRGASDVDVFKMDGVLFLAVANHCGDKDGYNTTSALYKMEGKVFFPNQTLHTKGARVLQHFVIDGNSYLAVGNQGGSTCEVNSFIYRWNGKLFSVVQEIPTLGVRGVTFFTINGNSFLVFSNSHNGSSYSLNSVVYKWQTGMQSFVTQLSTIY